MRKICITTWLGLGLELVLWPEWGQGQGQGWVRARVRARVRAMVKG